MEDENEYEKSKIFLERKTIVHISKQNGIFLNGIIVEVQPNFIIIKDKELGNKLILFSELKKEIEEYREEAGR